MRASHTISIRAPAGRALTAYAALAGGDSLKSGVGERERERERDKEREVSVILDI